MERLVIFGLFVILVVLSMEKLLDYPHAWLLGNLLVVYTKEKKESKKQKMIIDGSMDVQYNSDRKETDHANLHL